MKKYIYILLFTIISSCSSDFLNLYPQGYPNEGNFFITEEHFQQALNGVYEKLRGITNLPGFIMGEMRSDNTHFTFYPADRGAHLVYREDIANFIDDDRNSITNSMYYECYSGISRANVILDRISDTNFSETFKNSIIGPTKFLRAYFYFQLVRCYGGVPLYLHEVKKAEESFLPRASIDETYNVILSDIKDAISKLDNVKFPQNGTITQGAARMLFAKVLMTKPQREYNKAENELREIMKMGYELLPNYSDIFDTSNKNNKESIFEVQYAEGDQMQQSDWLYYFIPKTTDSKVITGVPQSSTMLTGGWNVPTQEMIDSYENGDKRLNASISVAVGHIDKTTNAFVPEEILKINDNKIKKYETYYFFIEKYRHPHSKMMNTNDNWPIYRYSDVLLSLSECLFEQGKKDEAIEYLNKIRQRAGLKDLNNIDENIISNERRHEFAFENHRWYDLLRTGKAIEVMSNYGKEMKKIYPYLLPSTYNITKERLLYPIPYRELQLNDKLTQNPGY